MSQFVDTLIVGQGLAGTVLAWRLVERGVSVAIIDDGQPITASQIAAGLVTPITGQRLVPSWRFDEFWPIAVQFYHDVEQQTGQRFFRHIPMLRLFKSEQERQRLEQTSSLEMTTWADPLMFQNPHGGFEMPGGQLDVPTFLNASRNWFHQAGSFFTGRLQFPEDVQLTTEGVSILKFKIKAKRVVFCQGFAARDNPWFHGVPFDPAKGEILTLRIPRLSETRVIHSGIWLAPAGGNRFRAGATYDRENLNQHPTIRGYEEICKNLKRFLRRAFEVVNHQAALRPIVLGRHPVVGRHPTWPQLGYFNGLGSKGVLQAPWIAKHYADHLSTGCDLEPVLDLQQRFKNASWND